MSMTPFVSLSGCSGSNIGRQQLKPSGATDAKAVICCAAGCAPSTGVVGVGAEEAGEVRRLAAARAAAASVQTGGPPLCQTAPRDAPCRHSFHGESMTQAVRPAR